MVNLRQFREYMESLAGRVPEITDVMAVTIDDEMAKKIMSLRMGSATLLWLPPQSDFTGRADAWQENNDCLLFVFEKFDTKKRDTIDVLETTQIAIEKLKRLMLGDAWQPCSALKVEPGSLSTMPETRFYAGFAGWSLGFRIKT